MDLLSFSDDFKLFFVMILFPLIVNILYFWISDTILKKKENCPEEKEMQKLFCELEEDSSSKNNNY